jgi:5'/3'-nucleotidase SurE
MEFVAGNLAPFDYIISGMNLGTNIGPGFPSGTVAAAVHGVALHIAPKGIILSLDAGRIHQLRTHDANESIDAYISYPLKPLTSLLLKVFANDLWGAPILNINFPEKETSQARITTMIDNLQTFYNYPIDNNRKTHKCTFEPKPMPSNPNHAATEETGALMRHVISITPWRKNSFFNEVYDKISDKDIQL